MEVRQCSWSGRTSWRTVGVERDKKSHDDTMSAFKSDLQSQYNGLGCVPLGNTATVGPVRVKANLAKETGVDQETRAKYIV